MPFYVYIILCEDGTFYTGYTRNLNKRTKLHAIGKGARYTRMHKPVKVAYIELFARRAEAMKREKQIKRLNHQQKVNLINSQNTPE